MDGATSQRMSTPLCLVPAQSTSVRRPRSKAKLEVKPRTSVPPTLGNARALLAGLSSFSRDIGTDVRLGTDEATFAAMMQPAISVEGQIDGD